MNVFEQTSDWAKSLSHSIKVFEEIESTNNLAKEEAFSADDFALYLAKHQTKGRGRYERSWSDKADGGQLLSSWSYRVSESPSPVLTARIGLSIVEALHHIFPSEWSLKAPNDLLLNGEKVGGLLIEAITQGPQYRLIIGLGLNVSSHPDIPKTSSLEKGLGESVDEKKWMDFLDALFDQFSKLLSTVGAPHFTPAEQSRLLHWLNKNPNLQAAYTSVGKDGSLSTDNETVLWNQL